MIKRLFFLCLLCAAGVKGRSQYCVDSLKKAGEGAVITPSRQFTDYAAAFLAFAGKHAFTRIDTTCKGTERVVAMIEKLNKGYGCRYFSNNKAVYAIDSYNRAENTNVNFGLLEIVYANAKEAARAYKVFNKRKYFTHSDMILRIYHPVLEGSRLLIFHTATPEDKMLKAFFESIGIRDFILDI